MSSGSIVLSTALTYLRGIYYTTREKWIEKMIKSNQFPRDWSLIFQKIFSSTLLHRKKKQIKIKTFVVYK